MALISVVGVSRMYSSVCLTASDLAVSEVLFLLAPMCLVVSSPH